LSAERDRKIKKGEPVPLTLREEHKGGNWHLPFTRVK